MNHPAVYQSAVATKQQRLEALFADCQKQVISQIIGPFGLSLAMFEDRNGGNVTTLHNFSREDDGYIAEKDKASHTQSRKEYDREEYEISTFSDKSQKVRSRGMDDYTGQALAPESMDADHITSLKTISTNKKAHLALDTGKSLDPLKEMANANANLAATSKSINRSKGQHSLQDVQERRPDFGIDPERATALQQRSDEHINTTIDRALMKKQSSEILATGIDQSQKMGVRQALGIILTELVNGLFNEFKTLIKHGIQAGKTLFDEIRERFAKVIKSVIKKIPNAIAGFFEGGISGFMSNLLTFLLNSVLSTAKRFVTMIRDGLLGLWKALKMIFFPPKGMTKQQALQEGLKILGTVIITSIGFLLNETVNAFMATVPFVGAFADVLTPVLTGIVTGLLSALLAYQIDRWFDSAHQDEIFMDELMTDAKRRDAFANQLTALTEISLGNIENYNQSIVLYQNTGHNLADVGKSAAYTLTSLEQTVADTREQVQKSHQAIRFINESQTEIERFLKTL